MRRFFEKISRDYSPSCEPRRHFTLQAVSVLTARSGSSSPDSACHREALRRGFGRRTKALSPVAQLRRQQSSSMASRLSKARGSSHIAKPRGSPFRRRACLPGLCSFTHGVRYTGCWSPKVRCKFRPARQRKNAIAVSALNIRIDVDFSRDASDKYCSGIQRVARAHDTPLRTYDSSKLTLASAPRRTPDP